MKKTIYWIVRKWKTFKLDLIDEIRKESARIASNEDLPKLLRAIFAVSCTHFVKIERKLAKDYLLYNPDMSENLQKTMERIIRDSGL